MSSAERLSSTRHTSHRVLTPGALIVYGVLTAAWIVSLISLLLPLPSAELWRADGLRMALLFALLGLCAASAAGKWIVLPSMRRPSRLEPPANLRVGVATTYVPGAEPLGMLERTLRALVLMKYPHDTWLLDEGDDPDARRICAELGVRHFTRKHRPEYHAVQGRFQSRSKHGNYNAWLYETGLSSYEIVMGIDPDHIPCQEFLTAGLGYFRDDRIAYIQAPQAYYNQQASFISAGAAEETYEFNSTIQMAAYGLGYPIIIGSHNMHRTTALREAGGYAAHDADDLLLTSVYRALGWHGVYVPEVLARGIAPTDWGGYLLQQRRWARSVTDLKFRIQPRLIRSMPVASAIAAYLQGATYLLPPLTFALTILLLAITLLEGQLPAALSAVRPWSLLVFCLLSVACYRFRQAWFLDPRNEAGFHWRARALRAAKAPTLMLAFADVVFGRKFSYTLTVKSGNSGHTSGLRSQLGAVIAVLAICWLCGNLTQPQYQVSVHIIALLSILFFGVLIATELRHPEPPFDTHRADAWISRACYHDFAPQPLVGGAKRWGRDTD